MYNDAMFVGVAAASICSAIMLAAFSIAVGVAWHGHGRWY